VTSASLPHTPPTLARVAFRPHEATTVAMPATAPTWGEPGQRVLPGRTLPARRAGTAVIVSSVCLALSEF
jgi:hypothetical protein